MSMLRTTDMAQPQGLSKTMKYEAVVVQNNDALYHPDKRMLGRIQFRSAQLFNGIEDELLPWAIPSCGNHTDGAGPNSGSFSVPKIGTKVLITFQDGSPLHPMYSAYTVDATTTPIEAAHNYPNRTVHNFANGCTMITDTQSNEVMFRNPGNLNIYVMGDVNLSVEGNVNEKINGNRFLYVKGNSTESVEGNKIVYTKGNVTDTTDGNRVTYAEGNDGHVAAGNMVRSGARIDDNPDGGGGDKPAAPVAAPHPPWYSVRGKKPDTNKLEPIPASDPDQYYT